MSLLELYRLYADMWSLGSHVHGGGPCRGLGKPAEAEPLCRRALRIREQAYGPESPNVATALTALADVLKEMGRCGDSQKTRHNLLFALQMDPFLFICIRTIMPARQHTQSSRLASERTLYITQKWCSRVIRQQWRHDK